MSRFLPVELFGWGLRLLLAQGVIVLFLLLNIISFSMPHAGDFKPFFLLMVIYYWAIYRPTVIPIAYTFALGLVLDLLTGIPFGLNALLMIALQTIVQRSRLFLMGQPYIMVWLGFGIMALAYAVSFWLLISLSQMQITSSHALVQLMTAMSLSILIFPFCSVILHAVHRLLPMSSTPVPDGVAMALEKESDKAVGFSRRAFIVGTCQAGFLALLGGRLAWLQMVEGGKYKILSEQNRINLKMMAPARGQIVDRFGVPFAVNNQNFRVLVVPEQTDDLEKSLKELQKHIDLKDDVIAKVVALAKKSPSYTPIEVTDDLNWEQVATVEVNIPDLPGMSIDAGEERRYPFADATAHIIGYVGTASKKDQENESDPLLTLPNFQVGKIGLERTFDNDLRGKAGSSEVEVNVVGREVRELNNMQSREGSRIVLSIDAELQRFAQQRLSAERSASAIVMDVHSGEIYALASYPAFDPNYFTGGISHERYEELRSDITLPLINKAVAGQYPPGSTFKMVTALAALEAGVVNENTTCFCPGHFTMGSTRFHCWKAGGHGTVSVVAALEQSCDTYFYKLSSDLGIKRLAAMARRLGIGQLFDMELKEERAGLVPDEDWKKKRFKEGWHPGETVIASIGQGYMLATPLQLAVMTSRIVNGGKAVKPWLAGYIGESRVARPVWEDLDLNPRHVEIVMRGMSSVCNSQRGTAYGSRIKTEGMEMGGKTGTAQVKRITKQERASGVKNEDLAWHFRHHALFVGYAPLANPRYACSVVVEHGVGGSKAAAPVARDLLTMTQERNPGGKPIVASASGKKAKSHG